MATIFRDKVTVGDTSFNDPLELPLAGTVEWGLDVLDGWNETPELDAQFTAIGTVDGEVPGEFFPARGRQLAIGGWAIAADRATAEALWDVLVGEAFPRNSPLTLTRHETTPKQLTIYVNGPREVSWVGPTQFRWGVPARAADPFKYALTPFQGSAAVAGQSTGGRTYPRVYPLEYTTITSGDANKVVFTNEGTASTKRIIADINGPLGRGSWRLVNEAVDGLIKFDVALQATDHLIIDFYNETATLNGAPVTVTMTGDFWSAPRGVNVIKLYGDFDPAVNFTITAYSAWE